MVSTLILSLALAIDPSSAPIALAGNPAGNTSDCPVYTSPASLRPQVADNLRNAQAGTRTGRPRPRPAPLPCAVRT